MPRRISSFWFLVALSCLPGVARAQAFDYHELRLEEGFREVEARLRSSGHTATSNESRSGNLWHFFSIGVPSRVGAPTSLRMTVSVEVTGADDVVAVRASALPITAEQGLLADEGAAYLAARITSSFGNPQGTEDRRTWSSPLRQVVLIREASTPRTLVLEVHRRRPGQDVGTERAPTSGSPVQPGTSIPESRTPTQPVGPMPLQLPPVVANLVRVLDTDHDGSIQGPERPRALERRARSIDANRDHVLTADEVGRAIVAGSLQVDLDRDRAVAFLLTLDRNQDGFLSPEELAIDATLRRRLDGYGAESYFEVNGRFVRDARTLLRQTGFCEVDELLTISEVANAFADRKLVAGTDVRLAPGARLAGPR